MSLMEMDHSDFLFTKESRVNDTQKLPEENNIRNVVAEDRNFSPPYIFGVPAGVTSDAKSQIKNYFPEKSNSPILEKPIFAFEITKNESLCSDVKYENSNDDGTILTQSSSSHPSHKLSLTQISDNLSNESDSIDDAIMADGQSWSLATNNAEISTAEASLASTSQGGGIGGESSGIGLDSSSSLSNRQNCETSNLSTSQDNQHLQHHHQQQQHIMHSSSAQDLVLQHNNTDISTTSIMWNDNDDTDQQHHLPPSSSISLSQTNGLDESLIKLERQSAAIGVEDDKSFDLFLNKSPTKSRKRPASPKTNNKSTPARKVNKSHVSWTTEQNQFLEVIYNKRTYIDGRLKMLVADKLGVLPSKIKSWFQNRRTKERNSCRKTGEEPTRLNSDSARRKSVLSDEALMDEIQNLPAPQTHPIEEAMTTATTIIGSEKSSVFISTNNNNNNNNSNNNNLLRNHHQQQHHHNIHANSPFFSPISEDSSQYSSFNATTAAATSTGTVAYHHHHHHHSTRPVCSDSSPITTTMSAMQQPPPPRLLHHQQQQQQHHSTNSNMETSFENTDFQSDDSHSMLLIPNKSHPNHESFFPNVTIDLQDSCHAQSGPTASTAPQLLSVPPNHNGSYMNLEPMTRQDHVIYDDVKPMPFSNWNPAPYSERWITSEPTGPTYPALPSIIELWKFIARKWTYIDTNFHHPMIPYYSHSSFNPRMHMPPPPPASNSLHYPPPHRHSYYRHLLQPSAFAGPNHHHPHHPHHPHHHQGGVGGGTVVSTGPGGIVYRHSSSIPPPHLPPPPPPPPLSSSHHRNSKRPSMWNNNNNNNSSNNNNNNNGLGLPHHRHTSAYLSSTPTSQTMSGWNDGIIVESTNSAIQQSSTSLLTSTSLPITESANTMNNNSENYFNFSQTNTGTSSVALQQQQQQYNNGNQQQHNCIITTTVTPPTISTTNNNCNNTTPPISSSSSCSMYTSTPTPTLTPTIPTPSTQPHSLNNLDNLSTTNLSIEEESSSWPYFDNNVPSSELSSHYYNNSVFQ